MKIEINDALLGAQWNTANAAQRADIKIVGTTMVCTPLGAYEFITEGHGNG